MKIAVCVPHYGDVKAGFAQSLGRMLNHTLTTAVISPNGRIRPEIELFFASASILPEARTKVVCAALDWGAEWLLLLDADQTFPPDTLFRLLAHGKPVVGCNCQRRDNSGPVIPEGIGLKEVDHLGLAAFLVHRSPFEAFVAQGSGFPLFMVDFNESRDGFIGEDVFFCRKLKAAGFPVFCDHELSKSIGHLAEMELTLKREDVHVSTVLAATGHQ